MRVLPNVRLCTKREDAKDIEGHVFLMDSRNCQPGFTRLVPVEIKDDSSFFAGIVRNTEGLFQSDDDGGTYMSSQRFVEAFVSSHKRKIRDILVHYRHGPCATVAQDLRDYNMYNIESDVAYALQICTWPSEADEWISRERHYSWPSEADEWISRERHYSWPSEADEWISRERHYSWPSEADEWISRERHYSWPSEADEWISRERHYSWPSEADEWISRERHYSWPSEADEWISRERHYSWPSEADEWISRERPSKETINKIRQHKAVAVGDPNSECSALEWRISFLLGERELVWSFNDTQIQCYYILKYFLKTYLDKLAPGQLSSYHIKTLMLWQCEESDPVIWNSVSLLSCVKRCLEKLQDYIERKELQHYFDRKRNLLLSKFENVEEKDMVLGKIEVLLKDIVSPVMQSITDKIILNNWNAAENLKSFFIFANYFDMASKREEANRIHLYNTLYATYILLTHATPDLQLLSQGLDQYTFDGTLDRTFVQLVQYFLYIRSGIELSKSAKITRDIYKKQVLLKKAQTLIEKGSCMDSMSAILYLATFHFSNEKFSTTSSLIETMLQTLNEKKPYYAGVVSKRSGIQIDAMGYAKESNYSFSEDDDLTHSVAYDIMFSPKDISVLPYAIQFECTLLMGRSVDLCFYHPVVYSFFLLCLSRRLEGLYFESVKALLSLERAIEDFYSHVPRHRTLSLLGYCYFSIGEYARAFRCYKRSLEDFSNVRNAAAYHIIILALNMMDNQILYVRQGNLGYY